MSHHPATLPPSFRPFSERLTNSLISPFPFPMPRLMTGPLSRALGIDELCSLSRQFASAATPQELASRALSALDIRVRLEIAPVPKEGPLIFVSNHPFGLLEGIVMLAKLIPLRPDLRIMANSLLRAVDGLADRFIDVDPFESQGAQQRNVHGLREAVRHLERQGAVVIFPAGTVSHWRKGCGISDPDWRDTALRLSRRTGATVIPLYFRGLNSLGFSLAGLLHPALRTMLLPRELLRKRHSTVSLSIGTPIRREVLDLLPSTRIQNDYLRMRCYALREKKSGGYAAEPPKPLAAPLPRAVLEAAIAELPPSALLIREETYSLYLLYGAQSPCLLQELGRTRELTFRETGEGTGDPLDLDAYDKRYHHLILWNDAEHEIAGGYRLGVVPELTRMHGPEGVYSSSLFRFDPAFFRRYGQSLELGRALVRPNYQRDFLPLLLLWKGIARFVLRHPSIRYLFGPVSLSLDASNLSLRLVTEYLVGQHGSPELEQLIRGRAPLSEKGLGDAPGEAFIRSVRQGLLDYKQLDKLIRAQEQGRGIPILFKHYLKLGGRIAAFHRDTSFNTLDAFLFVDLPQAPENMLRRYMGADGAHRYIARHAS